MKLEPRDIDRFWSNVSKADGCWLWTGSRHRTGYGHMHAGGKVDRRLLRANRVSWAIHFGTIPSGLWVLHHCDNPPCVNPEHLFLGTRSDNMIDCASKGGLNSQNRNIRAARGGS